MNFKARVIFISFLVSGLLVLSIAKDAVGKESMNSKENIEQKATNEAINENKNNDNKVTEEIKNEVDDKVKETLNKANEIIVETLNIAKDQKEEENQVDEINKDKDKKENIDIATIEDKTNEVKKAISFAEKALAEVKEEKQETEKIQENQEIHSKQSNLLGVTITILVLIISSFFLHLKKKQIQNMTDKIRTNLNK